MDEDLHKRIKILERLCRQANQAVDDLAKRSAWRAGARQALPIPLRALPGSRERAEPEAPRGQTKVLIFEVDGLNGLTLSASNNTLPRLEWLDFKRVKQYFATGCANEPDLTYTRSRKHAH